MPIDDLLIEYALEPTQATYDRLTAEHPECASDLFTLALDLLADGDPAAELASVPQEQIDALVGPAMERYQRLLREQKKR